MEAAVRPSARNMRTGVEKLSVKNRRTPSSDSATARPTSGICQRPGYRNLRPTAVIRQRTQKTKNMRIVPRKKPLRADFSSPAAQTFCHWSCSMNQPGMMATLVITTPRIPIENGFHQFS